MKGMQFLVVIALAFLILSIIEIQIINLQNQRRKDNCLTVATQNGTIKKATDYEYYSCLGDK